MLQTGGPEGIGCSFRARAAKDYIELMTTHLEYTFSHMLYGGVEGKGMLPILKDIHYATSDFVIPPSSAAAAAAGAGAGAGAGTGAGAGAAAAAGAATAFYEDIPDRILMYSDADKYSAKHLSGYYFGVYSYVPSQYPDIVRDDRFDAFFGTGKHIYASDLLPCIPYIADTHTLPNIFLIVGCLGVRKSVSASKVHSTYGKYFATHTNPSRYSIRLNTMLSANIPRGAMPHPKELLSADPLKHRLERSSHFVVNRLAPKGLPVSAANLVTYDPSNRLAREKAKQCQIYKQLKRGNLTLNARKRLLEKLKRSKTMRGKKN